MNMIADALRSLLEPLIWNALQWVWSLDATTETSALPLRFYSYSPTSFLLWIYEKLPHSWILFILTVGLCTILGVIIVISCCLGKVSSWILRVCFRYLVHYVSRFSVILILVVVRGSGYVLFYLTKSVIRVVQAITKGIARFLDGSVPEPNSSYQMIENPVVTQREESLLPIDPAAFHPRRRRTRYTRHSRPTSS